MSIIIRLLSMIFLGLLVFMGLTLGNILLIVIGLGGLVLSFISLTL